LVEIRVTANDFLAVKPSVPSRSLSYRNTWPKHPHESKPGTVVFDSVPTLTKTPWELERSRRPASQWSRGSTDRKSTPGRKFRQLPAELLHGMVDYLRVGHSEGLSINVKALYEDLRALCLSNKQMREVAREHLYTEIWLPSHSHPTKKRFFRVRRALSKLERLLRTLKGSSGLSSLVRRLRVTYDLAGTLDSEVVSLNTKPAHGTTLAVLTEVIKRCQNLEQLLGYAPSATENTAEFYASLASCQKMKSHVWQLPMQWMAPPLSNKPGALLRCHDNWTQLQTLVIVQQSAGWNLAPGLVTAILQKLPALQHLVISGLHPADFHNGTLLMLPALESLRLEELHGVTYQGLEQMARSPTAFSLRKLALCGLEITSLRTIQELLSEMSNLKRFILHQYTSPELSQAHTVASTNFALSSTSLEYLHWDVLTPGHGTTILANSIASGRFPNLRTAKIPCDNGAIQQLCRPIPYRPLAMDELQALEALDDSWGYYRSLLASQIQAQVRIHKSRKQPSFNVVGQDENSTVQHEHAIGSYLGNIISKIQYSLDPAVEDTSTALADTQLATYPGPYLTNFEGKWKGSSDRADGTREFMLDLDMFF
jgi:hypothetical protein